ncbi:MAG: CDP-alcohol phosphatidyltransferase family protein [Akkermansiaceae bacterium]
MRQQKPTFRDFLGMRATQSMWATKHLSYRLGAAIALAASRLGLSPNMLSLASAAITFLSCVLAVYLEQGTWLAGIVVILGLQIGYAFDCADGPLARVIGRESSFGSLLDKVCDLSSGMVFPCVLAYGAGHYYYKGVVEPEMDYTLRVLLIVVISRAVLSVLLWFKEMLLHQGKRLKEHSREKNLWWRIKRGIGLAIDEPVYRLGIGVAWALSWFWEFVIIYTIGIFFITIVYLVTSKREMDIADKQTG